MRLTTWNCHHGSCEERLARLASISPDIAVLQECARPPFEVPGLLWFGDNPKKGISMFARAPYTLSAIPQDVTVPRYVIPIKVSGPTEFTLLAVWTLNDKPHQYIRAVAKALEAYNLLLRNAPAVAMGDFNSNAIWDGDHPADSNHSSVVERMTKLKLVSAYHSVRGEEHGSERENTYYHQWNPLKGFHIDYCFVPLAWQHRISDVQVGSYDDGKEQSDHRPLTVVIGKDGI